jgi:hypothetical protein
MYADKPSVITPPLNNRARAIEIVDRLQNHVAPNIFQPRAIHDGRANLFSSHQLALSNGNSGSVRYSNTLTLLAIVETSHYFSTT